MSNVLTQMIEQLSEEDKKSFAQLAKKLKDLGGDVSKLAKDELDLIAQMEVKYADKFADLDIEDKPETEQKTPDDILKSSFASYARQILARDLNSQFPKEEDAVRFAFQNKWLPNEVKENISAEQLFEDYKQDICDANQWREEVVGVESDKRMAVGLTWFMVIFKLNERLN